VGRVLSSRHVIQVLWGHGLGSASSAAPTVVSQAAARHREHPGTKGRLVAGEVLDALGDRQPGLPCQVIGSARLFPPQVAQERGLQGVEKHGRRPILSGAGRFQNLFKVLDRRAATVACGCSDHRGSLPGQRCSLLCDTAVVVDPQFTEPDLAGLYEALHPADERADFDFYLPLVLSAGSVLDVGCGTGELLRRAREAGHRGHLCGLDPADAMLDHGRVRTDIEWRHGDLASFTWDRGFDLVTMTGHAFQVFVDDEQIRRSLTAIRSALTKGGLFVFETRNPLVRAWESWTPDNEIVVLGPDGAELHMAHEVETPVAGDVITFTTTFTSPAWDRPRRSRSTLRFLDTDTLAVFLSDAGLTIAEQFGDWDRRPLRVTSPEIITVATRA
jgi:SAM-dependent methyltransferase